tara:strand:- start:136 stop:996 length:861 start_codon:yes stop_codon:yes gene_type:complete
MNKAEDHDKYLLIDIGGTHIDLFEFSLSSKTHFLIKRLLSKNIAINEFLKNIHKDFSNYQKIIVGIPGDVNSDKDEIYCAPLEKKINIEIPIKNKIAIVNDMIIQAYLVKKIPNEKFKKLVIINIGTSIGICIVDKKFFNSYDFSHIKSYEFAHEKIQSLGNNRKLYDLISLNSEFHCEKFCSIYSVGGFASMHRCKPYSTEHGIIRVSKEIFNKFLSEKFLDNELTNIWISSLKSDIFTYLKLNSQLGIKYSFLLRGGLIDALDENSKKEILSKFNSSFKSVKLS